MVAQPRIDPHMTVEKRVDALDAKILLALDLDPDATALAIADDLGVARNTIHSRLRRLQASGALGSFGRRVDSQALGYTLIAFVSMSINQDAAEEAFSKLQHIPEIIEIHATTGDADLLAKVVAVDTGDLLRITKQMLGIEGVLRTSTAISLQEVMPLRLRNLLEKAAGQKL